MPEQSRGWHRNLLATCTPRQRRRWEKKRVPRLSHSKDLLQRGHGVGQEVSGCERDHNSDLIHHERSLCHTSHARGRSLGKDLIRHGQHKVTKFPRGERTNHDVVSVRL